MDWRERIVCTPGVAGGRPRIKGTRLAVSLILEMMASGATEECLLSNYPHICADDVRACLRYASEQLAPQQASPISNMNKAIPQEARAMLAEADERFKRHDYCEGSRLLWETVVWAIRDVAVRRGWPAEDERELEQVMERLDAETDEKRVLAGGFINALAVRDNADGKWLHESDIELFAELMPPLIEDIFAATGVPD